MKTQPRRKHLAVILFALGKDVGTLCIWDRGVFHYLILGSYRQRQKTAARIYTAMVIALINVNCGF